MSRETRDATPEWDQRIAAEAYRLDEISDTLTDMLHRRDDLTLAEWSEVSVLVGEVGGIGLGLGWVAKYELGKQL